MSRVSEAVCEPMSPFHDSARSCSARSMVGMLTFEEYKKAQGERLANMTEAQIRACFERDSTFAAFVLKRWLASRQEPHPGSDIMSEPSWPTNPGQ